MDREHGATESAAFVRRLDFPAPARRVRRGVRQGGAVVAPRSASAWSAAGATRSSATCTARSCALDGQAELVAGALSSSPDKARASAADLGLAPDRAYGTWQEMLEGELARPEDERIDFVTIVTPNDVHYPVAQGVRGGGLRRRLRQAARAHQRAGGRAGARRSREKGVVFGVTYNYTGYPLVREARDMVRPRRPRHDPQGHRGVQPGLARDAARAHPATSRPTGAPTRRAPARRARWATSARTRRTWRRRSLGRPITHICADLATLVRGPAPGRRRQPAAALRGRHPRRADRLADLGRPRERGRDPHLRRPGRPALAAGGAQHDAVLAARRADPHPEPRQRVPGPGRAEGVPARRPATPRATWRRSRTSTSASSRRSAPAGRAASSGRWRATSRGSRTAPAACASSRRSWRRASATRSGTSCRREPLRGRPEVLA